MKHANVAVFVPHLGCTHRCSFCSQKNITGQENIPSPQEAAEIFRNGIAALGRRAKTAQIAFYGGSFTAIPKELRIPLLEAAQPFLGERGYSGIRIATRPDAIGNEILSELKSYGVTAIELGAQSMDDDVLAANNRGHTADDTAAASRLIKKHGFSLGHHMMTGLYGSDPEKDIMTAEKLIALGPDTMRIHPALAVEGTELARLYREGLYKPQSLDEAVKLCAKLLQMFHKAKIDVIRAGLHDTQSLGQSVVAGPYHPAFRELCEGVIMLDAALGLLRDIPPGNISPAVHPSFVSRMAGQNKCNTRKLQEMGYNVKIKRDDTLSPFEIKLKGVY
ncbi:MAG: radical SAM protein [Oscillospiraceae bacterium]|nr:radical SAM protein [Oscillospiraceae bacterium]